MPPLHFILGYLKVEYKRKRKAELDIENFAKEIVQDCPKQENDCGTVGFLSAKWPSSSPEMLHQGFPSRTCRSSGN